MAEYIVGIDFGHGETAAWVVPINNSAEKNGYPLKLTASHSEPQIRSVVYKSGSGEYSLENNGCTPIPYFKGRIRLLNESQKKAYRAFIQLAFERILRHNQILKRDRETREYNFELCIACPTSWEDKDVKEYLDFFNDALRTKGIQVKWVIKESDAAFFSKLDMVDRNEVTLVIDYGSSTIDYTVLENMKKISKDEWSSKTLGASCIDDLLTRPVDSIAVNRLNATLENWRHEIRRSKNEHLVIPDILKLACRICKENYFKENSTRRVHVSVALSKYITKLQDASDEVQERTTISYYVDLFNTKEFTDYLSLVLKDLEDIRTRLEEKGKKVGNVILSGGACVMPWVADAVIKIFKGATIKDDGLPQFVVAKGVALYVKESDRALKILLDKLKEIDYEYIFKRAYADAKSKAISQLVPDTVSKIKSDGCLSGKSIREIYFEFLKSLNYNNSTYSQLIRETINSKLSVEVATAIADAIKEVFHKEVSTSKIKINTDPVIYQYTDDCFVDGGGWYNQITEWIEKSSSTFMPSLFFTWDDTKDRTETSRIAEGVSTRLKKYSPYGNETFQDLESSINDLKRQVIDLAISSFYENQLFENTFKL